MRRRDLDYALARKLFAELKKVGPDYLGDFYPLTPYSSANDVWLVWQYHRPDEREGVVQAFRRPDSNASEAMFKLRGLNPSAKYLVTDLDRPEDSQSRDGAELMGQGLRIRLEQPPSAAVITYEEAR